MERDAGRSETDFRPEASLRNPDGSPKPMLIRRKKAPVRDLVSGSRLLSGGQGVRLIGG